MLGFLKKKFGAAVVEVKKVENRDLAEAIIGGCMLVAASDGSTSIEELEALDKQIKSNDSLSHFGAEIGQMINKFEKQLEAGFRLGKMKILREIKEIANSPEKAEEVFINMLCIAEIDGTIDDGEQAVLREVGEMLGIRLADYGL